MKDYHISTFAGGRISLTSTKLTSQRCSEVAPEVLQSSESSGTSLVATSLVAFLGLPLVVLLAAFVLPAVDVVAAVADLTTSASQLLMTFLMVDTVTWWLMMNDDPLRLILAHTGGSSCYGGTDSQWPTMAGD